MPKFKTLQSESVFYLKRPLPASWDKMYGQKQMAFIQKQLREPYKECNPSVVWSIIYFMALATEEFQKGNKNV